MKMKFVRHLENAFPLIKSLVKEKVRIIQRMKFYIFFKLSRKNKNYRKRVQSFNLEMDHVNFVKMSIQIVELSSPPQSLNKWKLVRMSLFWFILYRHFRAYICCWWYFLGCTFCYDSLTGKVLPRRSTKNTV